MSSIVSSKKMYIYWGINAAWKSGNPASDKHKPFNPMVETQGLNLPKRLYDLIVTNDAEYAGIHLDKNLEPSTVTFRTYFRDPILLSTLFTYKGLPTSWTGTNDVMSFSFTNRDDVDENIWVQLHLPDQAGGGKDINILLDGGQVVGYRWIIEVAGALIEEIDIKFAEVSENTQAIDIDDGLDDGSFNVAGIDGGWSMWDGQLITSKEQVVLASACTITAGAVIAGLHIQRAILDIKTNKEMVHIQSSTTAGIAYDKPRSPYIARISGILKGNDDISEAIATLASKTQVTVKFQYATNKYMQFTIGVLKDIEGLSIPKAGEPINVTYIFEGGAASGLTFSWTGSEATDPSTYITHTDV